MSSYRDRLDQLAWKERFVLTWKIVLVTVCGALFTGFFALLYLSAGIREVYGTVVTYRTTPLKPVRTRIWWFGSILAQRCKPKLTGTFPSNRGIVPRLWRPPPGSLVISGTNSNGTWSRPNLRRFGEDPDPSMAVAISFQPSALS